MAKNIVVCCDGTANEFARDRTNVAKLFYTLVKDASAQACYYHPGVGTMAPPGFVTAAGAKGAEIAGLVGGYGLTDDICDAYIFIGRNWEPGDRLYLLGFSRGAYTARAIASLLRMYGLLPRDNERQVPYAVRMMWAIHRLSKHAKPGAPEDPRIKDYFGLADDFKATFSRLCAPHFVGVWDTVTSVGWFANPLSLPYTGNNADIAFGRHAVSIDERRAFFRPNLWHRCADPVEAGPKDMKQVWFPGVHCDVGGGYPEPESGLSKFALKWMIDEAVQQQLIVDPDTVELVLGQRGPRYARPDADACLHTSLTRLWRPFEYVRKPHWNPGAGKSEWRANHAQPRSFPPKPVVHDCAWVRANGEYAAKSLPHDAIRLSDAERYPGLTSDFGVVAQHQDAAGERLRA